MLRLRPLPRRINGTPPQRGSIFLTTQASSEATASGKRASVSPLKNGLSQSCRREIEDRGVTGQFVSRFSNPAEGYNQDLEPHNSRYRRSGQLYGPGVATMPRSGLQILSLYRNEQEAGSAVLRLLLNQQTSVPRRLTLVPGAWTHYPSAFVRNPDLAGPGKGHGEDFPARIEGSGEEDGGAV